MQICYRIFKHIKAYLALYGLKLQISCNYEGFGTRR